MKVDAVFRPLAELEKSMGELYSHWSDHFEGDREAAFLWAKMAGEERGHATLVDYQRRVVQKNPLLSGNVDVDLELMVRVQAEVTALRGSSPQPTLAEAVAFAVRLETSAAESHYRNELRGLNPEMQRLLSCLGSEDRGHVERLRQFAASRGIEVGTQG